MMIEQSLLVLAEALKVTEPDGGHIVAPFTRAEAVAIELIGAGFAIVKVEDGIEESLGFLLSVTREDMEAKGHAEHARSVLALEQVRWLKRALAAEMAS